MKRKEIEQRKKMGHHNHKTHLVAGGDGNKKKKRKPGIYTKKEKAKNKIRQEKEESWSRVASSCLLYKTAIAFLLRFSSPTQEYNIICTR